MKFSEIVSNFKQKELPESEVEFVGEIPAETLLPYRETALKNIAKEVELPGFRKGFVPPDMALKKIGELRILEEAVELLVRDLYPELIEEKKIDAVGRPNIRITKLAPGNPVELHIRTAVYPSVVLSNSWKKVGADIALPPIEIATEDEVQKTLESLQKNRARGETLPEINDEFAKSLGAFETIDALKAQIRKGIGEEKERNAKEKRRGNIIEALLDKTTLAVPTVFVESELEKILAQMKDDIARFKLSFEEYLKRMGKTEEDLRNDFREQARKRAKLQLVLNKIAEEEKIEADEKMVEEEMKHALEHFPDAKPELLRIHIETVLRNEKILQLLESSGKKE